MMPSPSSVSRRYRDQQARHDRGDQHLIDGVSLRGDVAQAFRMCSIAVRIESDISEVHGAPFGNRSQEPVAAHHLDLHVVDIPGTGATFFTAWECSNPREIRQMLQKLRLQIQCLNA